jgi:hypothetical protein
MGSKVQRKDYEDANAAQPHPKFRIKRIHAFHEQGDSLRMQYHLATGQFGKGDGTLSYSTRVLILAHPFQPSLYYESKMAEPMAI